MVVRRRFRTSSSSAPTAIGARATPSDRLIQLRPGSAALPARPRGTLRGFVVSKWRRLVGAMVPFSSVRRRIPAALPSTLELVMTNEDVGTTPPRRAGVSDEYLLHALEALQNAGDPAHLFAYWRWCSPKEPLKFPGRMLAEARQARTRAARTSVLFAALAAESYVNEFLAAHGVLQEWDREPTHRKYLKATAAACGSRLFVADMAPYPTIVHLLKLRDQLVHPKPGLRGVAPGGSDAGPESFFTMRRLSEYIVMVGYGAVLMQMTYSFDIVEMTGAIAWRGQQAILAYARRHARIPAWDERSERPLSCQVRDRALNLHRSRDLSRALESLPLVSCNDVARLRMAG